MVLHSKLFQITKKCSFWYLGSLQILASYYILLPIIYISTRPWTRPSRSPYRCTCSTGFIGTRHKQKPCLVHEHSTNFSPFVNRVYNRFYKLHACTCGRLAHDTHYLQVYFFIQRAIGPVYLFIIIIIFNWYHSLK